MININLLRGLTGRAPAGCGQPDRPTPGGQRGIRRHPTHRPGTHKVISPLATQEHRYYLLRIIPPLSENFHPGSFQGSFSARSRQVAISRGWYKIVSPRVLNELAEWEVCVLFLWARLFFFAAERNLKFVIPQQTDEYQFSYQM